MMTSYIIIIIIIISSWTPLKCVDRDWTVQNCSRSYCKEFHPHTDTIFLSLSLAPLCCMAGSVTICVKQGIGMWFRLWGIFDIRMFISTVHTATRRLLPSYDPQDEEVEEEEEDDGEGEWKAPEGDKWLCTFCWWSVDCWLCGGFSGRSVPLLPIGRTKLKAQSSSLTSDQLLYYIVPLL